MELPPATEMLETDSGDLIEAHRRDDPSVWGLVDVARGRTPDYPMTIYLIAGDSVSGVVGLLFPNGIFLHKHPSRVGQLALVGQLFQVNPAPFEPTIEFETTWDGARKSDEFLSEEGETLRESSKGLLLGNYQTKHKPAVNALERSTTHGKYVSRADSVYHKTLSEAA